MRSSRVSVCLLAILLAAGAALAKSAATVKCKDGTSVPAGRNACKDHGGAVKVPLAQQPAGATAKCQDGTYWHSTAHSGACMHHHGVAEWYDTNTR